MVDVNDQVEPGTPATGRCTAMRHTRWATWGRHMCCPAWSFTHWLPAVLGPLLVFRW